MEHAAARVPLGEHCGDVAPRHPGQRGLRAPSRVAANRVHDRRGARDSGGWWPRRPAAGHSARRRRRAPGSVRRCRGRAWQEGRRESSWRTGRKPSRRGSGGPHDFSIATAVDRCAGSSVPPEAPSPRSAEPLGVLAQGLGRRRVVVAGEGEVFGSDPPAVLLLPRGRRHRQLECRPVHAGRVPRRTGPPSCAAPRTPRRRRPRSCTCRSTRPPSGHPPAVRPGRSRVAGAVAQLPPAQPPGRRRPAVDPRRRRTVARGRERSPRTVRASRSRSGRFRATCQRAPRRRRAARAWPGPKPGPGRSRAAAGRRRRGAPGSGRCAARRPAAARTTHGRRRSRS